MLAVDKQWNKMQKYANSFAKVNCRPCTNSREIVCKRTLTFTYDVTDYTSNMAAVTTVVLMMALSPAVDWLFKLSLLRRQTGFIISDVTRN